MKHSLVIKMFLIGLTRSFIILFFIKLITSSDPQFSPELDSEYKPEIKKHPLDTYPGYHQPVKLECEVSGDPKPDIVWYKNDKKIKTERDQPSTSNFGSSGSVLNIFSFDYDAQGLYYCNASNPHGWVRSKTANVQLASLDDFEQKPQEIVVTISKSVILNCSSPQGQPKPEMSWTHNSKLVDPSPKFRFLPLSSLEIINVEKSDSGLYRCVARNSAGEKISPPIELKVQRKPTFIKRPKDITAKLGETVTFDCEISGDPGPTVLWKRKNEKQIPQSRTSTMSNKSLRIEQIQSSDSGIYVCYSDNSNTKLESEATLTVIASPNFSKTPDDKNVSVGEDVQFECVATGNPIPTVLWRFQDEDYIVPDVNRREFLPQKRIITHHSGTLFISSVRKSDEGLYECLASTGAGTVKSSAYLYVQDTNSLPIPVIEEPPQNITVPTQQPFNLYCSAFIYNKRLSFGDEELVVEWFKDGRKLSVKGPRVIFITQQNVQVNDAKVEDSGYYTCHVRIRTYYKNINPETNATAYVKVIPSMRDSFNFLSQRALAIVPDKLEVKQIGDTWIVLQWSPIKPIDSRYVVEMAEYNSPHGWRQIQSNIASNAIKVEGLSPDRGYLFLVRVMIKNQIGSPKLLDRIVFTKPLIQISNLDIDSLKSHVEKISFSNLRIRPLSDTRMKISWSECSFEAIKGQITGYNVIYAPTSIMNCTEPSNYFLTSSCPYVEKDSIIPDFQRQYCNSSISDWESKLPPAPIAQEFEEKEFLDASNVIINDLKPFTCYKFFVQAVVNVKDDNIKIRSKLSNINYGLTYEASPSDSPRDLSYEWIKNGTSLKFTWNPPDGIISHYNIYLFREGDYKKHKITYPERQIEIPNPAKNLGFRASISAENCIGEGPRSSLLNVSSWFDAYRLTQQNASPISRFFITYYPGIIVAVLLIIFVIVFILCCWKTNNRKKQLSGEKFVAGSQNTPLMVPISSDDNSYSGSNRKWKKLSTAGNQAFTGIQGGTNGLLFRHPPDPHSNMSKLMMEQALAQQPPPFSSVPPLMYQQCVSQDTEANAYSDPVMLKPSQPFCISPTGQLQQFVGIPPASLINSLSGNNTGSSLLFSAQPGIPPTHLIPHGSPPGTTNSSSGFCAGTGGSSSNSGGGVHRQHNSGTPISNSKNNGHFVQQESANPYASTSIFHTPDEDNEFPPGANRIVVDFSRAIPPPPQYPPPPVPRSGSSNSELADEYTPDRSPIQKDLKCKSQSSGSSEHDRRQKRGSTPGTRKKKNHKDRKFQRGPGSGTELQLLNQQPSHSNENSTGCNDIYDSQASSSHHYTYYCDLNGNNSQNINCMESQALYLGGHSGPMINQNGHYPSSGATYGQVINPNLNDNYFNPIQPAGMYNGGHAPGNMSANHFIPISLANGNSKINPYPIG